MFSDIASGPLYSPDSVRYQHVQVLRPMDRGRIMILIIHAQIIIIRETGHKLFSRISISMAPFTRQIVPTLLSYAAPNPWILDYSRRNAFR